MTAGDTVTLRCQTPANVYETIMFALLKVGAAGPVQLQGPVKKETDFSLQNVTAGDTGNYSCVYFQTSAPFWASKPSDHLEIWVTGEVCTAGWTIPGLPAAEMLGPEGVRCGHSLSPRDSGERIKGGPGFCRTVWRIFCQDGAQKVERLVEGFPL